MKKNILKKEKILEVISHHVTKYKPTCIHNINRDTNVVIEYSQRRLILPRFVTHRDTTKKHHRATECCSLSSARQSKCTHNQTFGIETRLVTSLSLINRATKTVSGYQARSDLCQHLYARGPPTPLLSESHLRALSH